ncbi:hypothetical protein IMSHALPRED_007132 [Imshaugia aleurites]|uniref:Uncharacterized protein n=1 Tax=Imshaugia aleurites TaxID=172621 RepID=A0A8H3ITH5_9LECA|nr:hypothetical protein IMSHALPRED_007132 [Imshaugia aleurites]
MAPAASCSLNAKETRMSSTSTIPPVTTKYPKRKFEDSLDLTEDGELSDFKNAKKPRPTSTAKQNDVDKAVHEEKSNASFEAFDSSNDHGSWKDEEPAEAQSAQTNQARAEDQLLFECTSCHETFENSAELHKHSHKHTQPPPIRCRKCRKTFKDTDERNHHFQTSARHFCCRYCGPVVEFGNADSLHYHYIDRHLDLYCHYCARHFPNTVQRLRHTQGGHRLCFACRKISFVPDLGGDHCRSCYSDQFGAAGFREAQNGDGDGDGGSFPDHYKRLGIGPHSSHEEVLKAAKEVRVRTHPDRLKRQEGLTDEQMRVIDVEAALVGQAADVLTDPVLRSRYDCNVYRW